MQLLNADAIFTRLREGGHLPYKHLPARDGMMLGDLLRLYDLRVGDRVALAMDNASLYLSVLNGTLQASCDSHAPVTISQGQTRLIETYAKTIELTAKTAVVACVVDGEGIDELMSFDTLIANASASDALSMQALERARRSPAFRRVPLECVEEAFHRMAHVTAAVGTEVIRQGEPGELFYVIVSGKAEVWRIGLYDDAPQQVDELGPGDSFGEEALITNGTRSASVRISANAELLTLKKADFQALISQQMVEEVEPAVANTMVESGYRLLDVRYAEEHEDHHIPGCHLVPLPELRARIDELDRTARWVVYCRSGKRSAVAALLMRQKGISAVSLRGGINNWPYATASA